MISMNKTKPVVAIVENDSALLKALERLLRAHGYQPELHVSAESFLERNTKEAIGCLILDIDLDGISGLELQRALLEKKAAPPIIFITGQGEESVRRQALANGCIAYLKKPFSSRLLIEALGNAANMA